MKKPNLPFEPLKIYRHNDLIMELNDMMIRLKVHLYHSDMVVTDQMMPNMDGIEMLQRIRKGEQVVAIVAPSILGQFSTTIEQVYGAFRQIGFTDIIEVAQGAMSTVEHEAHELIEKLEEGMKELKEILSL
jgi:CheY-like chemotaxis protein